MSGSLYGGVDPVTGLPYNLMTQPTASTQAPPTPPQTPAPPYDSQVNPQYSGLGNLGGVLSSIGSTLGSALTPPGLRAQTPADAGMPGEGGDPAAAYKAAAASTAAMQGRPQPQAAPGAPQGNGLLPVPPQPPQAPPPGPAPGQPGPIGAAPPGNSAPPSDNAAPLADFASFQPPPQQFAGAVAQAAQKYGVPPQVLQWTLYHESGYNPAAVGPKTPTGNATGIAQFMPGTAKQYGVDPTNPVQSIDGSAHYLSDLYKQTGSWDNAVQAYGTFSSGRGSDTDAALRQGFTTAMQKSGIPLGSSQVAGPGAQSPQDLADNSPNARLTQAQLALGPQMDLGDLTSRVMPTRSQQLLAVASGLLQGPTLGAGLGKGLSQMNNLTTQGRQAAMELGRLGIQQEYQNQLLGLRGGSLGVAQFNAQTHANQGDSRIGIAQSNSDFRQNPTAQGQVATAKAAGAAGGKDTAADIDELNEVGQNATVRSQQLQTIQSLLPQAGSGPGLAAIKRQIASYFGVNIGDTNPNSADLATTLMSQARGSGIMGKNMRTQKEFNTVMEGLATIDHQPQVLPQVIAGMQRINGFQQQAYNDWNSLPSTQRQSMRTNPDDYQSWLRDETNAWGAKLDKQPGGLYAPPGGNAAAPAAASKPLTGTANGVNYSFTPG